MDNAISIGRDTAMACEDIRALQGFFDEAVLIHRTAPSFVSIIEARCAEAGYELGDLW
jgi:hypothetical protein